jgi:hypothetical protein
MVSSSSGIRRSTWKEASCRMFSETAMAAWDCSMLRASRSPAKA